MKDDKFFCLSLVLVACYVRIKPALSINAFGKPTDEVLDQQIIEVVLTDYYSKAEIMPRL